MVMDGYPVTNICPYCGEDVILTTNDYLYGKKYSKQGNSNVYVCVLCKASVGTHPDGITPLGRLANEELKALKVQAHALFDPLWKTGCMTRTEVYRDLAKKLGIPTSECHFGWFDKDLLSKAINLLSE